MEWAHFLVVRIVHINLCKYAYDGIYENISFSKLDGNIPASKWQQLSQDYLEGQEDVLSK